jgi:hypothetical protein
MRTRSEGKQTSGEGESRTQDANVAEVSHGKARMANLSAQIISDPSGGRCERIGKKSPLTRHRKSDNHVTKGMEGSVTKGAVVFPNGPKLSSRGCERAESQGLPITENTLPGPVRRS